MNDCITAIICPPDLRLPAELGGMQIDWYLFRLTHMSQPFSFRLFQELIDFAEKLSAKELNGLIRYRLPAINCRSLK